MASDDRDLIGASLADPERFGEVFDRHHAAVWAYLARRAGRHRADELAGDVFVRAFAVRATYDAQLGSVRAWLYGIAWNVLRTRLRSDARAARAFERAWRTAVRPAPPFEAVDDAVDSHERLEQVVSALARLAPVDREVITLFAWERLSYEDVGAALGVPVGTVRSRLARARARLAELIGGTGEETGTPTQTLEGQ